MSDNLPTVHPLFQPVNWGETLVREGDFLLPVGTVTLLLADVEGSTRLWESEPDAMRDAVAQLDDTVTEVIGRHDGVRPLEQGEGDSFVAAFARAADAVACALSLQQALGGSRLRLRLGVHTGDVQLRDERNYVGQSVNRAARLRDIGHGGQVLVSGATHDLVVDGLPDDASLRDLGMHRLRDLARPEHVHQLCHPDLVADFPALRSLDRVPHNLPTQRTSFVGRAAEMAEVRRLLGSTSLLTLSGAGGCGKTRLALQVAAEALDEHPDGVFVAGLARITDPELVAASVADALSLKETPEVAMDELLALYLANRRALIVVDNCEHVLAAVASLTDLLLSRCPSLRILATSREPLSLDGEVTFRVPSLPFPEEREPAGIAGLSKFDAVQLFCDRAARNRPGFALNDDNADAVAEICRRLDGIPLAIELAAARVRAFTPHQISDGLDERLRFLSGGPRTALPRSQTLRASVDWSYDLLTETERAVLRRLSVFAGGFTLESAVDVCAGEPVATHQVVDQLSLLVDKSLVLVDDDSTRARYRLLETVRQYCAERLDAVGETEAVDVRHRDHFLALAEESVPHLEGGTPDEWLDRLASENDNLRAALRSSQERGADQQLAQFAVALGLFWIIRGHVTEAVRWLGIAAADESQADGLRARAHFASGFATGFIGDWTSARTHAEMSRDLSRRTGDLATEARATALLSWAQTNDEGPAVARATGEEAVRLAHESGDAVALTAAYAWGRGYVELFVDPRSAKESLERAVSSGRSGGAWIAGDAKNMLTWMPFVLGDTREGVAAAAGRIAELRAASETTLLADQLATAANLAGLGGQYAPIAEWSSELEALVRERGIAFYEVMAPTLGGVLALAAGDFGTARATFEQTAAALGPEAMAMRVAVALPWLAHATLIAGDLERADQVAAEIVETCHSNLPWHELPGLHVQGCVARRRGDHQRAEELGHEVLSTAHCMGSKMHTIDALELLAGIAVDLESTDEAARLMAAAQAAREATGYARCLPDRDADVMRLHVEGTSWAQGAALTLDDAVAYARRGRGARKRPSSGWASLSPAELQAVKLVQQGLSNPEIAERLFIAPATVKTHLNRIFTKLGITSRAQLAVEATRRGA